jgi:hypothetical protein
MFMEPSNVVYQYCLAHTLGNTAIALHLSNLQGHPLSQSPTADGLTPPRPKTMSVAETRNLHTKLSQNGDQIEEALTFFRDGGVVTWLPENPDQVPRILGAIQKLHLRGICVCVHLVIPFAPLQGCQAPELILDLWNHPLLQKDMNIRCQMFRFYKSPANVLLLGTKTLYML